ncbi:iron chelate uptake ABC transporter family permease subunit [Streptacidiphilus sp. P02-A3a]|uniref:FecCD family ABC transporter permease n=1 Tax=Streptacidiphilus sp. P02-A3a TaxID=2704468 RepID=UPI0015F9BAB7|nr:iron chelate uptake ABC transporter family permease subunit [Streptacidiphilus sp. P02-A3a]QMU71622.1 iron chelate uptake ABC transporter family permease subunit [Streptacidiphilus sp. P02-A3a]
MSASAGARPRTTGRRPRRRLLVGGGPVSLRLDLRGLLVCAVLALLLLAVCAVTLSTGDFPVPLTEVLRVLTGRGGSAADRFVIEGLRLPRLLTALLVGAALGTSGALFQSLSRNPLGSPDIVGFDTGAATGALVVILLLHGTAWQTAAGAVVGGLATALAVYLLALRRGSQGYRLILVGLGVAALLSSANSYLITRAGINDAQTAAVWMIGSVNGRGWEYVRPLSLALLVLLPAAVRVSRGLRTLELGEELSRGLGLRVGAVQVSAVLVGVGLSAAATAAAGPIGFVALAAPQIARRLTGLSEPGPLPAALTGAALLSASDLAAQRLLNGELPVGVVTAAVGGLYLAWLLSQERRKGRG